MKPTASTLALKAVMVAGLLVGTGEIAQSSSAPSSDQVQRPAAETPQRTSSNPWQSLQRMTAYRCLAEAIGTASDPKTGAPLRTSIDPQTGKPLCPPTQLTQEEAPKKG